jgi:hypothetical protein
MLPALAIWEFSRSRLSAAARVGVPASSPAAVHWPLCLLRWLMVVFGVPRPSSSSFVAYLLPLLQIHCGHACLPGPSTSLVVSSACLSLVARWCLLLSLFLCGSIVSGLWFGPNLQIMLVSSDSSQYYETPFYRPYQSFDLPFSTNLQSSIHYVLEPPLSSSSWAQIIPKIDQQTHKWRWYVGQVPPPNHMAHIARVR